LDFDTFFSTDQIRQRLPQLRWLIPLGLALLVAVYEVWPAFWIYRTFGINAHIVVEIVVFGTVGPILTFLLLTFLERWLEERETSDLQAEILAKAQQDAHASRLLSDDAIQMLFAAGTLITSLKESHPEMNGETAVQVQAIENSLNQAIAQIRSHLLLPHK
jgi:signal transduction histidine kinase